MPDLLTLLPPIFMFAALGALVAALFAGADRADWSEIDGVLSYSGIQRVRAMVAESGAGEDARAVSITSPYAERECAWFTTWASADSGPTAGDFDRDLGGRQLVLLTRSPDPIVFRVESGGDGGGEDGGGDRLLTVASTAAWVEPREGQASYEPAHPSMPLGGGPVHRSARMIPGLHHSWSRFVADPRVGPGSASTAVSEVRLEPGDDCELYGVSAPASGGTGDHPVTFQPPPGHAGVLVLRPGSEVPALVAAQVGAARGRAQRWRRVALVASAGFVVSLATVVAAL